MPALLSVGIDIGTSTTQVAFSRLQLENTAGYFSVPQVRITDKILLHKSRPQITPLLDAFRLDGEALRAIVAGEFQRAGLSPADVSTGAAIITGESARKENAAGVLAALSGLAGDFVVSTAGPDLESVIAGKGSGAWKYSLDHHCCTANLDIGGGTTNIALFQNGEVISTGCYDIGGRLVRLSPSLEILGLSPAAALVSQALGIGLTVGQQPCHTALETLTDKLAELLFQALGLLPADSLLEQLRTPGSSALALPDTGIDYLCFSGGVADLLEHPAEDLFRYGDIGVLLGRSLRRSPHFSRIPHIPAQETISATVIGAGTHTTGLSGSTIAVESGVLPLQNIPVLKLSSAVEAACLSGDSRPLEKAAAWALQQHSATRLVVALEGPEDPDYAALCRLASALAQGLEAALPADAPVLVVLTRDIAKALGLALRNALAHRRPCVVLDGIRPNSETYLDLGRPLMDGLVVPVVLKTLIFG